MVFEKHCSTHYSPISQCLNVNLCSLHSTRGREQEKHKSQLTKIFPKMISLPEKVRLVQFKYSVKILIGFSHRKINWLDHLRFFYFTVIVFGMVAENELEQYPQRFHGEASYLITSLSFDMYS